MHLRRVGILISNHSSPRSIFAFHLAFCLETYSLDFTLPSIYHRCPALKQIPPCRKRPRTEASPSLDGSSDDYPDGRQTPEPSNLKGFHQPRPSLSLSRFPTISNKQNLLFTRLNPIANDTTVDVIPDFYDEARLEDIDKQIQDDWGPFIIPTGHRTAPVAPNFFLEAKAPKGGADVAKRQACYNGAIAARAMHSLQSYKQEPIYDDNAYTITTTYHAETGTLQMYTTHLVLSIDSAPEYHMTQVKGWVLTSDPDNFR